MCVACVCLLFSAQSCDGQDGSSSAATRVTRFDDEPTHDPHLAARCKPQAVCCVGYRGRPRRRTGMNLPSSSLQFHKKSHCFDCPSESDVDVGLVSTLLSRGARTAARRSHFCRSEQCSRRGLSVTLLIHQFSTFHSLSFSLKHPVFQQPIFEI